MGFWYAGLSGAPLAAGALLLLSVPPGTLSIPGWGFWGWDVDGCDEDEVAAVGLAPRWVPPSAFGDAAGLLTTTLAPAAAQPPATAPTELAALLVSPADAATVGVGFGFDGKEGKRSMASVGGGSGMDMGAVAGAAVRFVGDVSRASVAFLPVGGALDSVFTDEPCVSTDEPCGALDSVFFGSAALASTPNWVAPLPVAVAVEVAVAVAVAVEVP